MISRRRFLKTLTAAGGMLGAGLPEISLASNAAIDRAALVSRHNPVLRQLDPLSPLTIGNGEFAFTADVTGLQTLAREYENAMPLCTMSQWGWHTRPAPDSVASKTLRLSQYDTYGREVGYQTSSEGQTDLFQWLRENPHRLHLGRIAFCKRGSEISAGEVSDIRQELDLRRGIITSRFKLDGEQVVVQTAVHPQLDLLAVSIRSALIDDGGLAVRFDFPYGSPSMQAADWQQAERHKTEVIRKNGHRADVLRTLDADKYLVSIAWQGPAQLAVLKTHSLLLSGQRKTQRSLAFVVAFSSSTITSLPSARATFEASIEYWRRFWSEGGAIELAQSKDPRAAELERRVVLSQYLTAIQCSGSRPPQETGLTVNSWYGKFHLEMHWWHSAQFALWDRLPLLEKSLGWYETILPAARALAHSQGYTGARWPKMVGPEGRDSPSPIGPLLIWQQPHPIFYAELCYQSRRDKDTLERYRSIVFDSAEFMASYAFWDVKLTRYVLGPPLIPAQENHPPRETWNPTFELVYWKYGLTIAQQWRERLGLKRLAKWDDVIKGLSALPVRDSVYLAHENCPQTFSQRNHDHPSMLAAYGVLPGDGVDRETMRRTLFKTMKEWKWDQTWGWDYPMTAMTAARLGETDIAIEALLMTTEKNRYLANGHNWQRPNLPCYLPGNGGLLYAVAMMAAGWQNAP
ncbi:MAG TPA: twin-arginine translocation signal domain-containing protein, partial [Pyrinomonadaceae bacterium]|nr:twin-arginine translocation signal domain-containing protein [Pyrinomonadaceae bacterium]